MPGPRILRPGWLADPLRARPRSSRRGLEADAVALRMVDAIAGDETDLPTAAFGKP